MYLKMQVKQIKDFGKFIKDSLRIESMLIASVLSFFIAISILGYLVVAV